MQMGNTMLPFSSNSLTVTAGYGSLIKAISLPSVVTFLRFHLSCTIAFLEDISNLSSRDDWLKFCVASCYCLLNNYHSWLWRRLSSSVTKTMYTYFWAVAHWASSQSGSVSIFQSPKTTSASSSLIQWAAVITYRRLIRAPPHLYFIFERRVFL